MCDIWASEQCCAVQWHNMEGHHTPWWSHLAFASIAPRAICKHASPIFPKLFTLPATFENFQIYLQFKVVSYELLLFASQILQLALVI